MSDLGFHVTLAVRDLARVGAFYEGVVGLARHRADAAEAVFGDGTRALLTLRADPSAAPDDRGAPGLFHTAFLLPDRGALGGWLARARGLGARLDGASDHLVSEALYLDDPEGNGVEVYADRPRGDWPERPDGTVAMATHRLDLAALAAQAGAAPATEAIRIGHVHLRVSALPAAEAGAAALGFAVRARYPGAVFTAAAGYHHHLAGNVWSARPGAAHSSGRLGLVDVVIEGAGRAAGAVDFGGAPLTSI